MSEVYLEKWMRVALNLAEKASSLGEVPVGAVIVRDDLVLAKSHNLRETKFDPTAHAEIRALQKASNKQKSWRLTGCDVFVTLEPCLMCAGALYQARVKRVIFGTRDPKAGACGSLFDIPKDTRLNHQFEIVEGVLQTDCARILRDFFLQKRKKLMIL